MQESGKLLGALLPCEANENSAQWPESRQWKYRYLLPESGLLHKEGTVDILDIVRIALNFGKAYA